MDKRQTEIDRGTQARAILDNPLWAEAWQACEAGLMAKFRNAPTEDAEGMQRIRLALLCMDTVRKAIEETMTTGKLAERQVAELQVSARERERRRTLAKEGWPA